jgi:hypothetical protein
VNAGVTPNAALRVSADRSCLTPRCLLKAASCCMSGSTCAYTALPTGQDCVHLYCRRSLKGRQHVRVTCSVSERVASGVSARCGGARHGHQSQAGLGPTIDDAGTPERPCDLGSRLAPASAGVDCRHAGRDCVQNTTPLSSGDFRGGRFERSVRGEISHNLRGARQRAFSVLLLQ